jgi:ABC-type transporter Mla subunit MlaD
MSSLKSLRGSSSRRPARGRPVGKARGQLYYYAVGVAGLIVLAVMFWIGYEAPNSTPLRSYYDIYAIMPDAQNLNRHYDVRIGGLRAGQVLNESVQHGQAKLHLQLASKFGPLRSDSTVQTRLRSAVGVRYLQLTPGTKGYFLPNGGTLAPSQTVPSVALDQVLGIFDARTRAQTAVFLTELGTGLAGRGEDVNTFIQQGAPFFSTLGNVSRVIVARTGAMANFISGASASADAFYPVRYQIAQGFAPETQALRPFTDRSASVQATLDAAPPALNELSTGLPAVQGLVSQVDGLAIQARPFLNAAPTALGQANGLLRDSQVPLRNLQGTLSLVGSAVPPTLGFLHQLPPVLPDVNQALNDLIPTLAYMGPRACDIPLGLQAWADTMHYSNRNGQGDAVHFTIDESGQGLIGGQSKAVAAQVLTDPYPGPCQNGTGVGGPPPPTPDQQYANQLATFGPGDVP